MQSIFNMFKFTDGQLFILFSSVAYFLYDAVSKKFEENAVIFKLYRWSCRYIHRHRDLTLLINDGFSNMDKRLSKVEKEVTFNGGSITLCDGVKELKVNQLVGLNISKSIQKTLAINENIRVANTDFDKVPKFESLPNGMLVNVNKAFLKFVGVEDKQTILGMGYLKVLSIKQVELLKMQEVIGSNNEPINFDGVLDYVHYITKEDMKGLVTTTVIKDNLNVPVMILGQVIPLKNYN